MQRSVFSHFGASCQQKGVANSFATSFTALKGGKDELSQAKFNAKSDKNKFLQAEFSTKSDKNEFSRLGFMVKGCKAWILKLGCGVKSAFAWLFEMAFLGKNLTQSKSLACERVQAMQTQGKTQSLVYSKSGRGPVSLSLSLSRSLPSCC